MILQIFLRQHIDPFGRLVALVRWPKESGNVLETQKGIVFAIDGAGGAGLMPFVLKRSLANLLFEFLHFRWGKGFGHIIADLTDKNHMRAKAAELSSTIKTYRLQNEDHRIYVVAKSAGTAIA